MSFQLATFARKLVSVLVPFDRVMCIVLPRLPGARFPSVSVTRSVRLKGNHFYTCYVSLSILLLLMEMELSTNSLQQRVNRILETSRMLLLVWRWTLVTALKVAAMGILAGFFPCDEWLLPLYCGLFSVIGCCCCCCCCCLSVSVSERETESFPPVCVHAFLFGCTPFFTQLSIPVPSRFKESE